MKQLNKTAILLLPWRVPVTGGHRTRVAAVTLDNMVEGVFVQREDLP